MRFLAAVVLGLLCAGCGGHGKATADAVAAPVVTPMQARERLVHDLDVQKQLARDRAEQFDEAADRDR
ncbi:MAG: hypothetical protein KDC48_01915 [Planctomycetes bacterium]|nr:hypothetical protein [Planctomycetota bacterium]